MEINIILTNAELEAIIAADLRVRFGDAIPEFATMTFGDGYSSGSLPRSLQVTINEPTTTEPEART